MNTKIKSIIDELDSIVPERDKHAIIEARANNMIKSVSYLVELIESSFEQNVADSLNRTLFSCIKSGNFKKFSRKIKSLKNE